MASESQHPYQDPEYQQQRQNNLGIIPRSAFLSAIARNTGTINFLLASSAVAAIISGVISIPVWGVVALAAAAIASAGISAYVGFLDERMSKTVGLAYDESRKEADARVNAHEIAVALNDTLGKELKDVRKESAQTQAVVAHLQHQMLSWQEREAIREPAEKVLH